MQLISGVNDWTKGVLFNVWSGGGGRGGGGYLAWPLLPTPLQLTTPSTSSLSHIQSWVLVEEAELTLRSLTLPDWNEFVFIPSI